MITWIHGLFGAPTDFAEVAKRLTVARRQASMPLPGHGGSSALEYLAEPAFEEVSKAFIASLDALGIPSTALIGYSMGARVAMHIARDFPERITELVVIGGHPGLEGEDARMGRQMVDRKRADRIRGGGLKAFLETWYRQPLFAQFRAHPRFAQIVEERSAGDPVGVATTLERLSTGYQAPLTEALIASTIPTLWVVGAEDTRYLGLLEPLAKAQGSGQLAIIPGAGHAVVTEAPEALADALNTFLG